jgi:hypothetical protein
MVAGGMTFVRGALPHVAPAYYGNGVRIANTQRDIVPCGPPVTHDQILDAIDQGLCVQKGHRQQLPSGPRPFKVEHIGAARRTKPPHKVQLAEKSASFEVAHDPVLPGDHLQPAVRGNSAPELTVPR